MYARGLTTRQISEQIEEIYGFDVSDVTDKILPDIEEWQTRPLENVYPIVFIDAIHFSVKENNLIKKLAAYVVLGVDTNGKKDGLSGLKESIATAFPDTEYQRCIVHQVRNTLKRVSEKDRKEFASDLKSIYHSVNEETAIFMAALKIQIF